MEAVANSPGLSDQRWISSVHVCSHGEVGTESTYVFPSDPPRDHSFSRLSRDARSEGRTQSPSARTRIRREDISCRLGASPPARMTKAEEAAKKPARRARATEIAVSPCRAVAPPRPPPRAPFADPRIVILTLPSAERRRRAGRGRERGARAAGPSARCSFPSTDRAVRVHGGLGARQLLPEGDQVNIPPRHTLEHS